VGRVTLEGVLRSELESHLARRIGEFVRNPVVRARTMVRLSVLGGVARPGYYSVPVETRIEDLLNQAGGPAPTAVLTEMRVQRGDERIWQGERLQQAIAEGRTVDALGLQAGDQLFVPQARSTGAETYLRIGVLLLTLPAAVISLLAILR
jgi:protein involved in polysaccharide export with SLBB domain